MKILMFVMILFLVGEIIFLSLYFIDDKTIEEKATPTTQYTTPIGPTQEPPYQLESEVILIGS